MKPERLLRTWTAEEMAMLATAVRDGRPLEAVAEELGQSLNAVRIRRQRQFPLPKPAACVNHGWSPGLGRIPRFWTEERVDAGLRDFADRNPGQLPNSDHEYSRLKRGHMEWPTAQSVLEIHASMANAWAAISAPKRRYTRGWNPWTQEEDDYLIEHAGEQTLKIIAKHLGRSWSACKRRLYDLGAGRARDVAGYLSAQQVATEYRCPVSRVTKLIQTGELRAFRVRGGHYWRIDLEDLPPVEAKLKAPRRTHRRSELDVGDYRKRKGLMRRVGADGRMRDVPVTRKGELVQLAKRDRARLAAGMRVAVRMMEEEGLIVDLGEAS